ncbi:hypothetical protein GGF32_000529 [Allomyces javanicus]|nr:hypothetical protein GGF32_000529 [Allomyces javanicus]
MSVESLSLSVSETAASPLPTSTQTIMPTPAAAVGVPIVHLPGAPEPWISVGVGIAFLPLCLWWLARCYRRWRVLRTWLYALLSSAWLAYSLDQVALVLYAAMYMQCPRPYLWSTPRLSQCASPWFLAALQLLQNCGAALFVTATLLRFRAAFTILSTKDGLICRVLSGVVAFVCAVRTIAIIGEAATEEITRQWSKDARRTLVRTMLYSNQVAFSTYGVCDLTALLLGLRLVVSVHRELKRHLQDSFSLRGPPEEVTHARRMTLALMVAVATLVLYVLVSLSGVLHFMDDVPLVLSNAINTSALKLYSAAAMLAIQGMQQLLASRDKMLELTSKTI